MVARAKKVAVKFCGCCNPEYDRSMYWGRIQNAARGFIEWVRIDDEGYDSILLLSGCQTSCLLEELVLSERVPIISVCDDRRDPEWIIKQLLN